MKTRNKNLILGTVKGYDFEEIKPFIISLKKTGFKGDLVLFVSTISDKTGDTLQKYGARLVWFKEKYPYIRGIFNTNDKLPKFDIKFPKLNIVQYRFIMYYLYLSKYGKKYSKVMLTDVRDVVFQKDPFDFEFNEGVHCFLEDKRVAIKEDDLYTGRWVKDTFGDKILAEIGDNYASCAGVTFGTIQPIMHYLETMIGYLKKGGQDQGIHQYMIYKNQIKNLKLIENERGPVLTLGARSKEKIRFNKENFIINDNGGVPNVLHQYDRCPELTKKYYSLSFKFNRKINKIIGLFGIFLKNHCPKLYFLTKKVKK